jgi:hypothetical protein
MLRKDMSEIHKQGKSWKDLDDFKHQWMLYVVWQKCLTNDDFAELLRLTLKDVFIIENTTNPANGSKEVDSSEYWGEKTKNQRMATTSLKERLN